MGRFRSTFVLVLIFVAFFAYFWIYQKDKKPPEVSPSPGTQTETVQLTMYKPEDLSEISWKSASYSATMQNSGDQKWKLTQPPIVTDESKTKSYVDSVISLTGSRKYSPEQLAGVETGLNTPSLTIAVKKKDNSTDVIKFGNKTVDGDYYYVSKEGSNTISLLSSYVIEDLNKDPLTLKPDPSSSPAASIPATLGSPAGSTTPQF